MTRHTRRAFGDAYGALLGAGWDRATEPAPAAEDEAREAEDRRVLELGEWVQCLRPEAIEEGRRRDVKRREKPWSRCDDCGRFISMQSFDDGTARRELASVDSAFSIESYTTLCPECVAAARGDGRERSGR